MQSLATKFFTLEEQARIAQAVQHAEEKSTGEIVPLITSASHTYPEAALTGAAVLALPTALAVTLMVHLFLWWPGDELWLFCAILAPCFLLARLLMRFPRLLRPFLKRDRMLAEVERSAFVQFFAQGLHATRDATGVLVYISVLERKVWILGDRGINERIEPQVWREFVVQLTQGIKAGESAEALCAVITGIGHLLAIHFPPKPDDQNELRNLIILDDSGAARSKLVLH